MANVALRLISDRDLKEELERRIKLIEAEDKIPIQVKSPDIAPLRIICQEHINELAKGGYDDGAEHYIYECAMETVFGKDVWTFINARVRVR